MTIKDNILPRGVFWGIAFLLGTIVFVSTLSLAIAIDSVALKHYNKGTALSRSGNLDQAIEEFKKAIDIDPNYGDAHYNLGYSYHLKAGQKNKTDPDLKTNKDIPTQIYIKKWEFGREELKLAIKEFKEVIRLEPNAADAHLKLGVVYDNHGDYEDAISEYHKTISMDPRGLDGLDARANLALIYYYVQEKRDEAIKELEAVLKVNPNHPTAKQLLKIIKK